MRNRSFRERITFQAANAPRYHNFLMGVGMYVTFMLVVLRGSLVVSGGTASGTSLGENPGGLIQRIEVDATPGTAGVPAGKLKNCSPRNLLRRRIFDRGTPFLDTALTGAAGTFTLNQSIPLNFAIPNAIRPFDTALKLDYYNDVRLTLTNGGRDTQFSGNDRTFDYSSLVYDIFDEREAPAQDQKVAVLYEEDRVINITAANGVFPIREQLPADGNYVDLLFISETTNQALADTIINDVKLYQGQNQFSWLPEDILKDLQQSVVTDVATSMTGLYYAPVISNNHPRLAGALPGVWAQLDVSNPGTDRLIVCTRRLKSAA
jgi:hypothetical protein